MMMMMIMMLCGFCVLISSLVSRIVDNRKLIEYKFVSNFQLQYEFHALIFISEMCIYILINLSHMFWHSAYAGLCCFWMFL